MAEFMLIFRGGDPNEAGYSAQQMQEHLERWRSWVNGIKEAGIFRAGDPLLKSGQVVHAAEVISDGPFAESKEVVGGFITVDVQQLENATQVAQKCPVLECGGTVEVRPIMVETDCH